MSRIFWISIALAALGASAAKHAGAHGPPLPPPLPWHVDAYIGFERAAGLDRPGSEDRWYYQNALQLDGARIKLHRETVVCSAGRIHSSEGDGGSEFYDGYLQGSPENGTAVLRYVRCENCFDRTAPPPLTLPIRVVSPQEARLGEVMYSKRTPPYPDRCPTGE